MSEVERRQNRQKLGCVPFLCGEIFDGWEASPIDRPDGGMAGWGHGRMGAWPDGLAGDKPYT